MSDLYIDGAMLDRVKTNFKNIESLLRGPSRAMKDLDANEVGPSRLEARMDEFSDDWDYGIGQLGEFADSVVEALQSIADAFDKADTDLAAALENPTPKDA
jgi:hypothetical protein